MRRLLIVGFLCLTAAGAGAQNREKTVFQTSRAWMPEIDVRADAAIVYGVGGNPGDKNAGHSPVEERIRSWKEKGYATHFMTGIAWGNYQDYFTGEWDGRQHMDEGQVQLNGDTIWHGKDVPYIVPSMNFLKYMKEKHIKRVIDAGIDVIYLEEPEFWAYAGYSESFKREWQDFYGFPWRPQHESPANTYLSNKLKYHLYYRALNECFTYAKAYGKSKGMDVKCFVPTHSLINYSQWQIVSPEASLASLPCVDGYIAQVWTGTSRVPNYYNGLMKERVFENAFLEYGCLQQMTAPTGRQVYFLTDPIEDNASYDWTDYKRNYEATFTAQLLYPGNNFYEVMPWPERIYTGLYKKAIGSEEKIRIPRYFSTQMQVMINTLNQMPLSQEEVSGSQGIYVLMSNSLMFQRTPEPMEGYDDPQLADFHGLAFPLLKRGVPVKTMHLENTGYAENWKDAKVLLMTYANMKPMTPDGHKDIAQWVRNGGRLVYCGRDDDAFQQVPEWWNQNGQDYAVPSDELFTQLGLSRGLPAGSYSVGKGHVYVLRQDPKELVMQEGGDKEFLKLVQKAYPGTLELSNTLTLNRGAYELAAVMDESVNNKPYVRKGLFIDLFDPALPVVKKKTVLPGQQAFLLNLDKVKTKKITPCVLAASARVTHEEITEHSYSFVAKSPVNTTGILRVMLPSRPTESRISQNVRRWEWDSLSHTLVLEFENQPEGVKVELKF